MKSDPRAKVAARVEPDVIAVHIVSHSRLLRDSLAAFLARYPHLMLFAENELTSERSADVVLVDGGAGKAAVTCWIRTWRATAPAALMIVFDLPDDVELILTYIQAGAAGYTCQGSPPAELVETIGLVRQGLAPCSPSVAAQLFAHLAARRDVPQPTLTPRELEVLRHIAADRSNAEIALLLSIEVHTVKRHVHNILEKLKLRHRWDAARFAVEHGWLDAAGPAETQ
jgi:DNA-binding NarL/FixJ family response regulator